MEDKNIRYNIEVQTQIANAKKELDSISSAIQGLKDNKNLNIEVETGRSYLNLITATKQLIALKEELASIKNQEKLSLSDKFDIEQLQAKISKLRAVYSEFITSSTELNKVKITDAKKQLAELLLLYESWDGQVDTFAKKFMGGFILPNSAKDQAKVLKTTIDELGGSMFNGLQDTDKFKIALEQLSARYQQAAKAAKLLSDATKGINSNSKEATIVSSDKKVDNTAKKTKGVDYLQNFKDWDGTQDGVGSLLRGLNPKTIEEEIRQIKKMASELTKAYSDSTNSVVIERYNLAIQNLSQWLKQAEVSARSLHNAMNPLNSGVGNGSSIVNQFNKWNGNKDTFSTGFMSGLPNVSTLEEQLRQYKRIASELTQAFSGSSNPETLDKYNAAISILKGKIQEVSVSIKSLNNALSENKSVTNQVATTATQEAKVQSAVADLMRERARLEELKAKIQMNYINNYKSNPVEYAKQASLLSKEYESLNIVMTKSTDVMRSMSESGLFLHDSMQRLETRAKWVMSNIITGGAFAGVDYIYESIKGVEKSIASFSQVMTNGEHTINAYGKSLHDMDFSDVINGINISSNASDNFMNKLRGMQNSFQELAVKYGEQYDKVAQSATLWGRMYKDNNIVLTMTNAAMKLAVADSFDIVEANKNLESSIAQWGFKVKDNNDAMAISNKICDSWTAIAHNMAVSAQDLSAANQRSAAAMNAINIQFDVGQALIATMLRHTQQSGAEIGNALKSIMGSIHSKKSIEEIEKLGVAMYKVSEDGKKEFRNVGDVLVDLMIKTKGTKDSMENLLKDISGGKWQWNKASALLNYQDFLQALTLSTQSYGFTNEQVGMQLDTVARKSESLHQELIKLFTGYGSLSGGIKSVIDGTIKLIKFFDGLSGAQMAAIVGGTLLILRGNQVKNMITSLGTAIGNFVAESRISLSLAGGGWLKLIGIIIDVGVVLYELIGQSKNAMEQIEGNMDALNNKIAAQQELISRKTQALENIGLLATAYNDLKEKIEETTASGGDANEMEKELSNTRQAMVNVIGEEGVAEAESKGMTVEAVQEEINKEKERVDKQKDNLNDMRTEMAKLTRDYQEEVMKRVNALDVEKNSWGDLSDAVWKFGGVVKWLEFRWNALEAAMNYAKAGFKNKMADGLEWVRDTFGITSIMTRSGSHEGDINSVISEYRNDANGDIENGNRFTDYNGDLLKQMQFDASSKLMSRQAALIDNGPNPFKQERNSGNGVGDDSNNKSNSSNNTPNTPKDQDGREITNIPDQKYYAVGKDRYGRTIDTDELMQDLELKLRVLDDLYYKHTLATYGTGEHLTVTSGYRPDDTGSNHGQRAAFDVSGGRLDNDVDLRQWLHDEASWIGLFSMNEYPESPYSKYASGSNIHFSEVTGSGLDQYGGNEGLYGSTGTPQPTIYDILGGNKGVKTPKYVDNSVQRKIYDMLVNDEVFSLNDKAAWGAMASMGYESANFNPAAEENPNSTDTGIGIMQWSNDPNTHEGRRKQYEQFVAERARYTGSSDWRDIDNQIAFMKYERQNGEFSSWENYINSVKDNTSAYDDVSNFTQMVERAGVSNIDERMKYYNDVSSYYVNGKSLRDSNPKESKKLTPEQLADKEAKRLHDYYARLTSYADNLKKIVEDKYKDKIQSVSFDEELYGKNASTIDARISASKDKIKSMNDVIDIYKKNVNDISRNINDKSIGAAFKDVDKKKFLEMSVEEQQKLLSTLHSTNSLQKPMITTLNYIIENKRKQLEYERSITAENISQIKLQREKSSFTYNYLNERANDSIKEWEISNSNDKYDDRYRNNFEQRILNMKAQYAKDQYEYDTGRFADGTPHETDSKVIEGHKIAWMEADAAAKKYAATLKNNVKSQFTDMAKSIFIEGNSIRDYLKNLWKQLAEDALTLLMSGGKQGTGSFLGNVLMSLFGGNSGGSAFSTGTNYFNTAIGGSDSVLPSLFSYHHIGAFASGGEVDTEQLAKISENNKKEFVIPVEDNKNRGMDLWRRAGKALGVVNDGTAVTPDFQNHDLAQNGVMSVQVKQQAIYMDEIRQQNKTLLDILSTMVNQQGNSETTTLAPVIVKQNMSMDEFTRMAQKGKSYGYLK